jgi:hypothetical protein
VSDADFVAWSRRFDSLNRSLLMTALGGRRTHGRDPERFAQLFTALVTIAISLRPGEAPT